MLGKAMTKPIELTDAETAEVAGGLFNNISLVFAKDNSNSFNTNSYNTASGGGSTVAVGNTNSLNSGTFWRSFNSFSI